MTEPRATAATLSFSAIWDDTVRMLRANAGLLTAIAGVFLFLPAVLVTRYLPPPEATSPDAAQYIQLMSGYFSSAWPGLLLANLLNMLGVIAIYLMLLAEPRLTVGAAMARALPILPFYYLMTLALNFSVAAGFLLLIVPGIYLLGRLVLASPAMVIEAPRSPFKAFERSWALSKGRGWSIALMVVLVYLTALLISFAVTAAIGAIILIALGGEGIGGLIVAILEAAVGATVAVVATVLIAAIYRTLAQSPVTLGKTFS